MLHTAALPSQLTLGRRRVRRHSAIANLFLIQLDGGARFAQFTVLVRVVLLQASSLLRLLCTHCIAWLLDFPGCSLVFGQTLVEKLSGARWRIARPSIRVRKRTVLLLGQIEGLLLPGLLGSQLLQLSAELVLAFRLPGGHLALESRFKLRVEIDLLLLHQLLLHRLDL